ncbi:hypothetical protein R3P38DRAFT_1153401 [Favolaschia claudopus]|uniref:F-box domain-containing protein n=1 Tax=Favolaschia claudopus TaxID=2862362 RepID=A0AAW0B5A0_9AGAR
MATMSASSVIGSNLLLLNPPAWILALPLDAILSILSRASPMDILALRETCAAFRALIDSEEGNKIWRVAYKNVLFSPPFGGPYTPAQIAALTFKGGDCYTCRMRTPNIPESFSLNVRYCSHFCKYMSSLLQDVQHYSTLPFALPYLEGTDDLPLYRYTHWANAWEAHRRLAGTTTQVLFPSITPACQVPDPARDAWMLVAQDLCKSGARYRIKKTEVDCKNYTRVKQIASDFGLDFVRIVTGSPTLARHVNFFSRDLEFFDVDAWQRIRPLVLSELRQRVSLDGNPLPCPFCPGVPRVFSEDGLRFHITERHPEHTAEYVEVPNLHRCSMCLLQKKTRVAFDWKGLIRHRNHRH